MPRLLPGLGVLLLGALSLFSPVRAQGSDWHVTLTATPNPVIDGRTVTVTATLSQALPIDWTFSLTTTRNTSEAGDHGSLDSITIPAGQLSATAEIATYLDSDLDDETFTVALTDYSPFFQSDSPSVTITIIDTPVWIFFNPYFATETEVAEGRWAGVSIVISRNLGQDLTIPMITTRNTSEAGDHDSITSLTIPAGQNNRYLSQANPTIYTYQDDDTDDEKFTVTIDTANLPPGVSFYATPIGRWTRIFTIIDDEVPPIQVSLFATPNPVKEGSPITLTITLSRALSINKQFSTGWSPGLDYLNRRTRNGGVITIPAGQTSGTITAKDLATRLFSNEIRTEKMVFSISNIQHQKSFELVTAPVEVKVIPKPVDTTPVVTLTSPAPKTVRGTYTVREGATIGVTAKLSKALSQDVTIPLTTSRDFSEEGDHGLLSSIRIPAGQTSATATISTYQDEDTKDEYFSVRVDTSNVPSSVRAGTAPDVAIRIIDGANLPTVTLSGTPNPVVEGSVVRVTARLSEAALSDVRIPLTTTRNTSEAGDHGSLTSVTIPAGQTFGTGTVSTWTDSDLDDETFTVAVDRSNLPSLVGPGSSTGVRFTITDITAAAWLSVTPNPVKEGNTVTVTVNLAEPLVRDVSIALRTGRLHGGRNPTTAEEGDFQRIGSRAVRIPAGQTSATTTISTYKDDDSDDETFMVEMPRRSYENPATKVFLLEPSRVRVTITDKDQKEEKTSTPKPKVSTPTTPTTPTVPMVSLSATPNPVVEGSAVRVTARLSEALSQDVTVPLTTTRNTSEAGDHGSLTSVRIPAGQLSATATVSTSRDDDRDNEVFSVALDSSNLPSSVRPDDLSPSVVIRIRDTTAAPLPPGIEDNDGGPSPDILDIDDSDGGPLSSVVSYPVNRGGPPGVLVAFGELVPAAPVVSVEGGSAVSEGAEARFTLSAAPAPAAGDTIEVAVSVGQRGDVAGSNETGPRIVVVDESGTAVFTVATAEDTVHEPDGAVTVVVEGGTGYTPHGSNNMAAVTVEDNDATAAPTQEKKAWSIRLGRTVSQQVVDVLQQRFSSSTTPSGLEFTLAGEALSGDRPLEENHVLLSRLLGFETLSSRQLVEGSSFSFSPEGAGARLSFWGKGAFSSFDGIEESITLTGDVTTALLGAEWNTQRWRAGAALSHSWGNGSYQGEGDGGDGRISSSLTGIFPYGRYALTPRLGIWATAGYGWGSLSLNPDGDAPEYNPATTMALGAVGMDGLLLDGGSEGVTLTTTADALFLKTSSEAVVGLASSEGNISRLRLGLEATRPFPLANGASLSPSLEVGLRQDSGDAETGFGMDLGAGLSWSAPEQGITAAVKGRTLLSHGAEDFQDQGLALSFSWQPTPSNRGASLSLSHAVGLPAEGGMAALLNPTAIEVLDDANSSGERFEARLAYGFPFYNDRLTLTPAVATALSNNSRTYGLLWSLAPYDEHLMGEPWQLSLEGERQEHSSSSTVDHSLKLRFALPL